MKYCSIVRKLASQSANWLFYGENFRFLRQKGPWLWDEIHSEFYLRAHLSKNKLPPGPQSGNRGSGTTFPKGFPWKYHNVQHCAGCPQFPIASKTPGE